MQRVAEDGVIPTVSLRELGGLVLRPGVVALSSQLLAGPPKFALRLSSLLGTILRAELRGTRCHVA